MNLCLRVLDDFIASQTAATIFELDASQKPIQLPPAPRTWGIGRF
jgi:hypothetical protein